MTRINVKLHPKRCSPIIFGILYSGNPGINWEHRDDHADNELVLICDDQITDYALQSLLVELQFDEEVQSWDIEHPKENTL